MADVFISYAREDRPFAAVIAQRIERRGWSVWWDRKIRVGRSFSRIIEQELDDARCVVVVWSRDSIDSDWVLGEAAEGARRDILIPISIDEARPPLEFRRLHTARISLVDGQPSESGIEECLTAIDSLLAEAAPADAAPADAVIPVVDERKPAPVEPPPSSASPARPRKGRSWVAAGAALVLGVSVTLSLWLLQRSAETQAPIGRPPKIVQPTRATVSDAGPPSADAAQQSVDAAPPSNDVAFGAASLWNEAVAGIAWDNMTPAARVEATQLLQKAPADACLLDLFPQDNRPLAARQREFFVRAATWADIVRPRGESDHRSCTRFHHGPWHFVDHFWKGVSGATGSDAPQDFTGIPTPAVNAVERLETFRRVVPCADPSCGTPAERATELAWMLHLVGDIHQPLHTASRVTARDPQGDAGGNAFKLGRDSQAGLHTYWDHIVGTTIPPQPSESSARYLDRVISVLAHDHPRTSLAADLHPGDFEAWASEGFAAAKASVYPASLVRDHPPDTAYRQMAFQVSDRAIALGGYRLANLMNQMFQGTGPLK